MQPGKYGSPMLQHDMDDQILEPLHYAELGLPKYPWKYGILENASDDARELIANKLDKWKHPVDTRTAEDGRDARQKWFTGASWSTFCAGRKGSPGGPKAIAELMLIVAEDMQQRGVTLPHRASSTTTNAIVAAEVAPYAPPPNRVEDGGAREGGGGRGKHAFAARNAVAAATLVKDTADVADKALIAKIAELERVPSAMERAADPEDIGIIRNLYGSRATTIINALLAFDAYFA